MRRAALHTAVAVAMLVVASLATASPVQKTSITDVEDEVMCPICGTLLELADSPQAQREKVYVAKLIAAGKTKAQVKDALVAQYGPAVLAQPRASGFNLSAYLAPAIAILIAIAALAFSVARWRRDGRRRPGSAAAGPPPPEGEDAKRLEADLSRYDL